MFSQHVKTRDYKGDRKENNQRPRINLDHITCNDCGEKVHYTGNSDCPTQANPKEDAEAFRKKNKKKSSNKPPGVGDQKDLVNVKESLFSLKMGAPT